MNAPQEFSATRENGRTVSMIVHLTDLEQKVVRSKGVQKEMILRSQRQRPISLSPVQAASKWPALVTWSRSRLSNPKIVVSIPVLPTVNLPTWLASVDRDLGHCGIIDKDSKGQGMETRDLRKLDQTKVSCFAIRLHFTPIVGCDPNNVSFMPASDNGDCDNILCISFLVCTTILRVGWT